MGKENAEKIFHSKQVDAVILTSPANMRYMAGFCGEGYVYLSEKKQFLVTDSRYTIAAKKESPDFETICYQAGGYYSALLQTVEEEHIQRLGFEDLNMTVAEYEKLKNELEGKDVILVPLGNSVKQLRQIKEDWEIHRIRQAEAIGDRAFKRLLGEVKAGMTEKQVAARLEFFMKEEGAEGLSFDTIAASGPHSAMPHAVPTDRKLTKGDLLTMDFGCLYQGYCSDMTRTIAIGKVSEEQRKIYDVVKKAQETALAGIRPGMTGAQIDKLARNVIKKAGYGEYFGHALGHSVGLEIHESPNFSPREETVIRPGMVITVEPGIYVEGVGGVRIEDVVVITEDGCENITHSAKEWIEVEE